MKNQELKSEERSRPSSFAFFRSGSRSPDRLLRTGRAHVATAAGGPPQITRVLLVPRFSNSGTSFNSQALKAVNVEDFADTDSSSSYLDEARDAETIYLIIQEYQNRDSEFLFLEDFESSGSDTFYDTTAFIPDIATAEVYRPHTPVVTNFTDMRNITTISEQTTEDSRLPEPDLPETKKDTISLLSGELLSKLDSSNQSQHGPGPDQSFRNSYRSENRSERILDRSLRLSMGNFTAGLDLLSELPVMLYTVQDRGERNTRWSVYEKERLREAPNISVPRLATLDPARTTAGTNTARSITSLNSLIHSSKSDYGSRTTPKGGDSQSPQYSDHKPVRFAQSPAMGTYQTDTWSELRGSSDDLVQPPTPLLVQDSSPKQNAHNDMYSEFSGLHFDYDLEKHPAIKEATNIPWTKWAAMMAMGLLAVPVFFLLAFGFFDYGGHLNYLSQVPPLRKVVEQKRLLVNYRYFRRYSHVQKVISFVLGLLWIGVVLAMIGVGFGIGVAKT